MIYKQYEQIEIAGSHSLEIEYGYFDNDVQREIDVLAADLIGWALERNQSQYPVDPAEVMKKSSRVAATLRSIADEYGYSLEAVTYLLSISLSIKQLLRGF